MKRIYLEARIKNVLKEIPEDAISIFGTRYYFVSRFDALKIRHEADETEILIRALFEEGRRAANRARHYSGNL